MLINKPFLLLSIITLFIGCSKLNNSRYPRPSDLENQSNKLKAINFLSSFNHPQKVDFSEIIS